MKLFKQILVAISVFIILLGQVTLKETSVISSAIAENNVFNDDASEDTYNVTCLVQYEGRKVNAGCCTITSELIDDNTAKYHVITMDQQLIAANVLSQPDFSSFLDEYEKMVFTKVVYSPTAATGWVIYAEPVELELYTVTCLLSYDNRKVNVGTCVITSELTDDNLEKYHVITTDQELIDNNVVSSPDFSKYLEEGEKVVFTKVVYSPTAASGWVVYAEITEDEDYLIPVVVTTQAPAVTEAPTATSTNTPVPTATSTPTPTNTSTPVPTAISTPTPTNTSTPVPTATNTPTPTNTSTPVPTATNTPTPTSTSTPTPSATSSPMPTVSYDYSSCETLSDVYLAMLENGEMGYVDISRFNATSSNASSAWNSVIKGDGLIAYNSATGLYIKSVKSGSYLISTSIANMDEDFLTRYTLVKQSVDDAMSLIQDDMSDIEKALVLHDYIVDKATYVSGADGCYYTWGIMAYGKGVCMSYSASYSMLLTLAGITNAQNCSDDMNHIWTIVKLDGKWYQTDVTWDDTRMGSTGKHYYFLRTDDEFENSLDRAHYNYRTYGYSTAKYQCTDTYYTDWFMHDVKGNTVYLNGYWYYADGKNLMKAHIDGSDMQTVLTESGNITILKSENGVVTYKACGTIKTTLN